MNYRTILFTVLFVGCAAGIFGVYTINHKKMVYVKIGDLYDGFQMKKELENVYVNVQKQRKQQLDSLELELKIIDNKMQNDGQRKELLELFDAKRENYFLKKKHFEEDGAQMQEEYTGKIRQQLNQYVMDYGKDTKCDYIFGAEGSGALMYAADKDDVTKDVLTYINNKYKGVK